MCDMGAHHWSGERTLSVNVASDLVASAH
jgi:hypothetical protein